MEAAFSRSGPWGQMGRWLWISSRTRKVCAGCCLQSPLGSSAVLWQGACVDSHGNRKYELNKVCSVCLYQVLLLFIFLINSRLTTRIKGIPACGEHHPGLTHTGSRFFVFSLYFALSLSLLPASCLALSPHYHRGLRQVSLSSFGIHLYPAIAIQACELHSLRSLHSLRCFRSATFFCSSKDSHEL